ncbi:MAG TPA: glycosyltransferase [Solirubrobacteraceae bacterium]|jgi:glycosyltransferase involved in cell wall biosynthesis|nr:glycosyltransferase [Solirubrobacteraceae bacterium]
MLERDDRTLSPVLHVGYSHTLSYIARESLLGLREAGWPIHVACPEDDWTRRIHEDGFQVWNIRLPHRASVAQAMVGAWDLLHTLRNRRFGLVHTHNAHHGVIGRHVARALGVPSVHTWRYNPVDASNRRAIQAAYSLAEGSAARAGNYVFFQNADDMAFALGRRIVPEKRAMLVGNGIRIEHYERHTRDPATTRAQLGVARDAELILCIARMAERKGIPDLIDAFALLAPERPTSELVCLGSGPHRPRFEAQARSRGLAARVHFAGQRDDVPDVLAASDVLALTSSREGVPRAIMEAMAARVPVVATDVVGTRAIVQDGQTGLLVPFASPRAIARAIARIMDDQELRVRLTAEAYARLVRDWHQSFVVERMDMRYRELLPSRALAS